MNIADKSDIVTMVKVRANLLTLASYYTDIDFREANKKPKYNCSNGPRKFKVYTMSKKTAEATRFWKMSESNVWSEDETLKIKRFYNAKRKSGELEKALLWERPMFAQSPSSVNWWRAKLHKLV